MNLYNCKVTSGSQDAVYVWVVAKDVARAEEVALKRISDAGLFFEVVEEIKLIATTGNRGGILAIDE